MKAAGLANIGTVNLSGAAPATATFNITGAAANAGSIAIGGYSALNASGETYTQSLGTTTVAASGALTAATIDVTGGVLQGA